MLYNCLAPKLLFILMCGITFSYALDLGPATNCTTSLSTTMNPLGDNPSTKCVHFWTLQITGGVATIESISILNSDGADITSHYMKSNDQTYLFPLRNSGASYIITLSVMQTFEPQSNRITRYPIRIHYYAPINCEANVDFVNGTLGYTHHDDSDELFFSDNGNVNAEGAIDHDITLSGGDQNYQAYLSISSIINTHDDYNQ